MMLKIRTQPFYGLQLFQCSELFWAPNYNSGKGASTNTGREIYFLNVKFIKTATQKDYDFSFRLIVLTALLFIEDVNSGISVD